MFSSAAVVGRSHESAGVACQDAVAGRRAGGVVAIALADGAGSARHSGRGAQTAVSTALDLVTGSFDSLYDDSVDAGREKIVGAVVASVTEDARALGASVSDFASTLLFVAVKGERYLAAHLGDGVIVAERSGERTVLSHPQRGEHVNETVFVTSRGAAAQLLLDRGTLGAVSAFAVMSDGSAESLYMRRDRTTAAAITSMWSWLDGHPPSKVSAALASNLRDHLRLFTGDDCSLALLRRVTVMADKLPEMDVAFAGAFLDCRSPRGLHNRLAVLAALGGADRPVSTAELSARSSLSVSAFRRHARYLRELEPPARSA